MKLHSDRCWRLAGRTLPLDYASDGVFKLVALSENAFVLSMRTSSSSIIEEKFAFPLLQQHANAKTIRIEENWSESGAHLQSDDDGLEGLGCFELLKSAMAGRSSLPAPFGVQSLKASAVSPCSSSSRSRASQTDFLHYHPGSRVQVAHRNAQHRVGTPRVRPIR